MRVSGSTCARRDILFENRGGVRRYRTPERIASWRSAPNAGSGGTGCGPDRRLLDLLGIDLPIVQAPMAGATDAEMAIAVSESGGLGSLPCALLTQSRARAEIAVIRQRTSRPFNVNFFCHREPHRDREREDAWRSRLERYYAEFSLDPSAGVAAADRAPFDDALCDVVAECRPNVVSFHFGLPEPRLLRRVKETGCKVISSATTVDEARWLEDRGCDAVIAQGYEAGGHRGMFLTDAVASQPGTLALVPQVVDAVAVPVLAAGGIADGRGIAAAFALGAAGVQIGTAYLATSESTISGLHRAALAMARDDGTVLTNVFTGRPARGLANRIVREVGPIAPDAPEFPTAGDAVAPIRAAAEAAGSSDFTPLWSGQAAGLARTGSASELTRKLAAGALERLGVLARIG